MPKIATAQGRSVAEWIGPNPDAKIPERVRLRIWDRCDGRDYFTGRKIMPGDAYEFHHVLELADGGEHREMNLVLALKTEHAKASADARTARAKVRDTRKTHLGLKDKPRKGLPPASPARRATTPPTKIAQGPSAWARRFNLEDA